MLFDNSYKKNLKRFNFYVDEIINRANAKDSTPDCGPMIRNALKPIIERSKSQIENWNSTTNVEGYAYKMVYNIAFDILSSGELHIHRGVLDPLKQGKKLKYIIDDCLEYYLRNGIITKEQEKEQRQILSENLATVG